MTINSDQITNERQLLACKGSWLVHKNYLLPNCQISRPVKDHKLLSSVLGKTIIKFLGGRLYRKPPFFHFRSMLLVQFTRSTWSLKQSIHLHGMGHHYLSQNKSTSRMKVSETVDV